MAEKLNGKYSLVSQQNLEELLKVLGIEEAKRKVMAEVHQDREFIIKGKHIIMNTLSTFTNHTMEFNLGEEFEEDMSRIDGRICKTTVTWDGNKMVGIQKCDVPNRTWKQWLEDDTLHAELTAKDVVCTQIFKRVQ